MGVFNIRMMGLTSNQMVIVHDNPIKGHSLFMWNYDSYYYDVYVCFTMCFISNMSGSCHLGTNQKCQAANGGSATKSHAPLGLKI